MSWASQRSCRGHYIACVVGKGYVMSLHHPCRVITHFALIHHMEYVVITEVTSWALHRLCGHLRAPVVTTLVMSWAPHQACHGHHINYVIISLSNNNTTKPLLYPKPTLLNRLACSESLSDVCSKLFTPHLPSLHKRFPGII